MIIRYGPIVSAASGSLGSMQFVARRTTPVVRIRPRLTRKTGTLVTNRRILFDAASRAFQEETTIFQRAAWKTAATLFTQTNPLGTPRQLTARQYFLRTNLQAWVTPGNYIVDPPLPVTLNTAPIIFFDLSPDGPWTMLWDNPSGAASHVVVSGFPLYPVNQPPRVPQVRFFALVHADDAPHDLINEWLAVLPRMVEGSTVWMQWYGSQQTGTTPGGRGPVIGREFIVGPP